VKTKDELKEYNRQYQIKNRAKRTEYRREYRSTEKGAAATYAATKKYGNNNKARRSAWGKAKTINRKPCEVCGNSNSVRHHPDITRPLDIIFLCHLHHVVAHNAH
jgi:hypothetical protein